MKVRSMILSAILAASTLFCFTGCVFNISNAENADKYTAGDFTTNSEVKAVEIDWLSGSVTVTGTDDAAVSVTETCNKTLKDDQKVQTWLDGTVLHINFCKPGVNFNYTDAEKKLEVKLPKGVKLYTFSCDCTSAETDITDISAGSFDVDATSGNITVSGCNADTAEIESTSGLINVSAETVKELKVISTSGNTEIQVQQAETVSASSTSGTETLYFGAMPATTSIDTTAGAVTLYLPQNADFTAAVDTTTGNFNSDLPLSMKENAYVSGSGTNKLNIDTTSGNIAIHSAA